MIPEITALKGPIAIRSEYAVDTTTTFRIQQHGKARNNGDFTVFRDSTAKGTTSDESQNAQTLMSVKGQYVSEKRSFYDASGLPLFDLYHKPMGLKWYAELPGGTKPELARLAPNFSMFKDNMDIYVPNADGHETMLQVRGQDIWKQRTNVFVGDCVVMTVKRVSKMSSYLPGKVEWEVTIGAGMDIALASAIVVVMAVNMYNPSFQSAPQQKPEIVDGHKR